MDKILQIKIHSIEFPKLKNNFVMQEISKKLSSVNDTGNYLIQIALPTLNFYDREICIYEIV